ncbi:hypothetical protein PG991_007536 [Apiospora marii]|uniref:Uncharacterized protein n=1 Tax=Apiospora marii TaxID=335849 RepID=A0ABR1RTR1_9PEZI
MPGHVDDIISKAPSEASGDEYRDYLTAMIAVTAELHRSVMPALRELCDDLELVTSKRKHNTSLDMFPGVESLVEQHGCQGFMEVLALYQLSSVPLHRDNIDEYVGEFLEGCWESEHAGIQHLLWGEVTKTVLIALRVCFAMSLLMRSLLITENRVVDVPDEERAIYTGVSTLKEMLELFGVMCTKATEFVKNSTTGVAVYQFPEAILDDPFIKGLLQPAIDELGPYPSAGPTFTPAQLLNANDDSWEAMARAAQASSPHSA